MIEGIVFVCLAALYGRAICKEPKTNTKKKRSASSKKRAAPPRVVKSN